MVVRLLEAIGLLYIDYPTGARIRKTSFHWYQQLAKSRACPSQAPLLRNHHRGPAMSSSSEAKATLARQLIEGLAKGEPDQVRALFAGPADIDDPFAGRQVDGGFERLVRNWGPAKLARIESMTLDHLTEGAGGRFCGAEYSLNLIKRTANRSC